MRTETGSTRPGTLAAGVERVAADVAHAARLAEMAAETDPDLAARLLLDGLRDAARDLRAATKSR